MKKLLSVILAVMMVMTSLPTFAVDGIGNGAGASTIIPEGATLIFAEDFESGYTTDTDLLGNGKTEIEKNGVKVMTLENSANLADDVASVKVVDGASNGFDGKVLEIKDTDATKANAILMYFNFAEIDTQSETINGEPNPLFGKQIVMEYDAKANNCKEDKFMGISTGTKNGFQRISTANIIVSTGVYAGNSNDATKRNWYSRPSNPANLNLLTKKHIKTVFEQNAAVDTIRTYGDGVLIKSGYQYALVGDSNYGKTVKDYNGENYAGQATMDYGKISYLYSKFYAVNASKPLSAYIDNLVIYAVDPIEFDKLENNTNVNGEGFTVSFTQPFDATKDTFAVSKASDAANAKIAGAVKEVVMAADKMSATVKVDLDKLDESTSYMLWVDDEFTSAAGAIYYKDHTGISEADEWQPLDTFTTCKKLALESITPETLTGYVEGDAARITLTFNDDIALSDAELANAFTVTDAEETEVSGLSVAYGTSNNIVVLELAGLTLGRGNHTIKSEGVLKNSANTFADVNYTFGTLDFNAKASETEFTYVPTTNKEVVVALTMPTTLEDLASGFVVKAVGGENEIAGLTATANGNDIVLQLSGLPVLEAGQYVIDVTDALVNAQGKTAMLDSVITFTVPEFVIESISDRNFTIKPGAEKNVEIELSIPTGLTNEELFDAIYVEDAAGNAVRGLGIVLDAEGKVITLYLQDLNAGNGKYTIKSNDNLVDQAGRTLKDAIKVPFEIAEYVKLMEDDFEGLEVGTDLTTVEGDAYSFKIPSSGTSSAKIIDGSSKGFDGNVLELRSTCTDTSAFDFVISLNGGNAIDTTSPDSPYYGKQLVYEFDVQSSNLKEMPFMNIDSKVNLGGKYVNPFQKATGNGWALRNGEWNTQYNISSSLSMVSKTSMKVVFDQTGDIDVVRTYANGALGVANRVGNTGAGNGSYFNGRTVKDFVGEYWYGDTQPVVNMSAPKTLTSTIRAASSSQEAIVYIDNFKAYLVDSIDFADENEKVSYGTNNSAVFNPVKGLEIAFTQRVDADALKKALVVTKTDDVNQVPMYNTIRNIKLTDDGKIATVQFDANVLEGETAYTLWLDDEFTSAYGALMFTNAYGVLPEDELVELTTFTTSEKLEVTVDKTVVSNYDKGKEQEINITLSSALAADVDANSIFVVKDEAGNVIEGLVATVAEDRLSIKLQLSGLQLGNGVHTIESLEGKLINEAGIEGSAFITVGTVDFVGAPDPVAGTIRNYVQGAEQLINVALTTEAQLTAGDIANYFEVKDSTGAVISGLKATLSNDRKLITIDLSGLVLGVGEHTIKAKAGIKDSRGREITFDAYNFSIMPFTAGYESEVTDYVPGSDDVIEIKLSYALNEASIANIANAFTVKNKFGSAVSGLGVTVSEDKKVITLDLQTLDIEGGEYAIASKAGALVNIKGEVLADIAITLSTSAATEEEVKGDTGVGAGSGSEMTGDFISTVLLEENFDNEDYTRDMNWLTNNSFVPAKFSINKVGKESDFVDSYVSIVEDPVNPGNYVLKNVAGYKDATNSVIAGIGNYHTVKRELESGAVSITADDHTIIKMYTKVFIPNGGAAGIPTGDNHDPAGDTKNDVRIIALTNAATSPLNHANLRQSSGSPSYNTYISNSNDAANGSTGSVAQALSVGEWHEVELIFGVNTKKDSSKFSSYEVYIDGTKITSLGGAYKADFSTIGGMMSMLVTASGGSGTTTVLYDDWSITKTNRLQTHINVAKEEVPQTQAIKLQLTSKLTDESIALIKEKDLITIKDSEGNDVKAEIKIDNTGINTKVEIIPAYGLKYQTEYAVEIAENFTNDKGVVTPIEDVNGEIFGGFNYEFETAKALGNTIDLESGSLSYDADYMHEEDTFNYTMALKEAATTPVIGAVATFDGNNKLLGIEYKTFELGDTSKAFNVTSELGAKYIRLFIWEKNPDGTMGRLMQIPDEVTSR